MLYDGVLQDLPLFLHSSNRGVNVILHEPEVCVSQRQCCDGSLHDLPLFMLGCARGGDVILNTRQHRLR